MVGKEGKTCSDGSVGVYTYFRVQDLGCVYIYIYMHTQLFYSLGLGCIFYQSRI